MKTSLFPYRWPKVFTISFLISNSVLWFFIRGSKTADLVQNLIYIILVYILYTKMLLSALHTPIGCSRNSATPITYPKGLNPYHGLTVKTPNCELSVRTVNFTNTPLWIFDFFYWSGTKFYKLKMKFSFHSPKGWSGSRNLENLPGLKIKISGSRSICRAVKLKFHY